MNSIASRFSEFKQPNYFSRFDKEHILDLRIGLDDKMRKCIELRCEKFKVRKVSSTNVLDVDQLRFNDYYCIRF